jgi:DHA2 family multidrug resistance protein
VEEITWVATGYMLSNVITMPLVALLSGRFGRKWFFMLSVFLFTIASMLCGLAWDLKSIVAFRAIQGIGGGALIPVSQAILWEAFPAEERGTAMGIYGFGVVLGPALGPVLGGWLTDNYSWPWIFFINVPLGILTLSMVMKFIDDPPYFVRMKATVDFIGVMLLALGLGSLQLMLEKGEINDWFNSNFIRYLALSSFIGLILFAWRELKTDKPAVNLRILKDVNFAAGLMLSGVFGVGLYTSIFVLPLFLQELLGYPAYNSGLALMPRSIAMALAMPLVGKMYNRLGPRFLIFSGFAVSIVSFFQLARLSLDVGYWDIFFPQFIQGIGFSLIFVALSTAALSTIDKTKMTDAAGLYNVIRYIFGSVGIAIAATQITRGANLNRAIILENVTEYSVATIHRLENLMAAVTASGVDPATCQEKVLRLLESMVMRQAGMIAYNYVFFLIACFFFVSLPFIFLLKK